MAPGVDWHELKVQIDDLTIEEFLEKFPNPFLVLMQRDPGDDHEDVLDRLMDESKGGFDTIADTSNQLGFGLSRKVYYLAFERKSLRLGRSSKNDLCVNLPGISKHHATFYYEDEIVLIEDASSKNGTFLGGQSIHSGRRHPLEPRDQIRFSKGVLANVVKSETLYRMLRTL